MATVAADTPAMPSTSALSGFGPIFRKEVDEWMATNRFVIATALATLFTAGPIAGYWIYKGGIGHGKLTVNESTYDSLIGVVPTIISTLGLFMVIALTMGIITREQDKGTLQWIFTKPVSRSALVVAKWLANSLMTIVAIALIPTLIAYGVMDLLFGVHDRLELLLSLPGIFALFIFQCALSCAIAAISNSSAAVAGISFALFFLPTLITPIIGDWARLFPAAIADVANRVAQGEGLDGWDAGTIISTIIVTIIMIAFATYRLSKREYR